MRRCLSAKEGTRDEGNHFYWSEDLLLDLTILSIFLKTLLEKERVQREEEERRNRIELEQFKRKFDKRRKDDKRRRNELPSSQPYRPLYTNILVAVVSLAALFVALWWTNF